MNRNRETKTRHPNPVSNATFLSKFTYWWLKPLFQIGLRRSIEEDDIYAVTNSMRSNQTTETFAKLWNLELKKQRPSLLRVIRKVYGFEVLIVGILYAIAETFARVIQPMCLGGFVTFFAQNDDDANASLTDAYWYATGIVVSTAFITSTYHPYTLYTYKRACQMRVACSGLIYRKSLRITKSCIDDGQNGHIINLLSNDLWKFDKGLAYLYFIWKGPLETLAYSIVIYREIGISAMIGMAFMVAFVPLQGYIGKISGQLRMKNTERTDVRVKIMNEIFHGIQVIKMYAWEKSFAKLVGKIRKKEVNVIRWIVYIQGAINSLKVISKVSIFLSLSSYIYFGNAITARKVFIVSSYFNILSFSMVTTVSNAFVAAAEAWISIKRVQEFLLKPESKCSEKTAEQNKQLKNGKPNDEVVTFENYRRQSFDANMIEEKSFIDRIGKLANDAPHKRIQNIDASNEKLIRFEKARATWKQCEKDINGIFDISIEIKPGLCAIIGQVGSGKSTLLNVILGELDLDLGSITINGTISMASQEPWIFEASVRSNIIFVEDFHEQRYNRVVEVCALERDFRLLPNGDATIVGERGSSLSGGQRARVNLARAIYKQADIYLLDDPLSAVDAHVGKHIFEKCIKQFLKDKICVLVTHQLQYLKNEDHVVLLNDGKLEAQGPFQTLQKFNKKSLMHAQEVETELEGIEEINGMVELTQNLNRKNSSSSTSSKEIEELPNRDETKANGSVQFGIYKAYFQAVQSDFHVVIVFVLFILAQFAWSGLDYFLSEWVNWEEKIIENNSTEYDVILIDSTNATSDASRPFEQFQLITKRREYLIFYACLVILATVSYLGRSLSFYQMCLKVSINLHDMMFRGVTRAKMIFFNNNPSGRILNRFAGDISDVDTTLPITMLDVIDFIMQYMAIVTIAAIVNLWLLIPAIMMTLLFYLLRRIYMNTGRCLRRIDAMSRSPIYSHVNATFQGLATIRAFNASAMLESEFHDFQDHSTSSYYLFVCTSRWFGFWLDVVCCLFITFVTYSFLLFGDPTKMHSGEVGLTIMSSISLIVVCQWGMRQSALLENQMTSVERILEYADLQPEPPLNSDKKNAPSLDWPSEGKIEFKALSLRYAENSHRILRDMTFRINAKAKIGVVGRTGAGKSSIIQSLFRLAQNEGQILIDDVDIEMIGLHDLRKNISIIPQEAILFSGSLRFNLDPFGERSDDELWDSLEQVELKTMVSALPNGIDGKVLDGGLNFSSGQRQLFCLARAILRNNKILILDEATANVDSQTDKLIQETIRSRFADCTVITIAHRLNTIMDSDQVLVIDAGKIVEFDHPFKLIQKSDGIFKRLFEQNGNSTLNALTLVAKENYERCKEKK